MCVGGETGEEREERGIAENDMSVQSLPNSSVTKVSKCYTCDMK